MRRPLIAANWKMNLRHADAVAYCRRMRDGQIPPGVDVVIFPPFPLLRTVSEELPPTAVSWGGQDIHPEEAGAHTGNTAGSHLCDWGSTWALCGHSERRAHHAESDELVGQKVSAAFRDGLAPMLCVGETQSEREKGQTEEVLARQLRAGLRDLDANAGRNRRAHPGSSRCARLRETHCGSSMQVVQNTGAAPEGYRVPRAVHICDRPIRLVGMGCLRLDMS